MKPITALIPEGRENAVTRFQLVWKTGERDRQIRREIAEARREGDLILNRQDGGGYYRPSNPQEVLRWYRQEHARAMKILVGLTPARRWLKEQDVDV